jgi:hypothetical protein
MKKILILIVVLAGIAGAYFFLSKPAPSSDEESGERGSEVAKTSAPIVASGDVEDMDESSSTPETTPLTKIQPAIEVTVREDVAEAIEESADDIVEVAEDVAEETEEIVEDVAEAVVIAEEEAESIEAPVMEEIGAESAANAAAIVEESTTVVEESQESLQAEADAAAEAMASEIAANNAALVEEVEVEADPREELFMKLEAMVASGTITKDQFALLTAAMAASGEDSEITSPEWLLDPPAVDWTAVAARIQSLKDTGSITDEQFGKFQANIAKYQPVVEAPEETLAQNLDAAVNQTAAEDMMSNASAAANGSAHSESASKYDVRINGYPLPSHLSSNMKFSIVELFLNKDAAAVSSQRITINNHLVPQSIDPVVLSKLFDLLVSREASE